MLTKRLTTDASAIAQDKGTPPDAVWLAPLSGTYSPFIGGSDDGRHIGEEWLQRGVLENATVPTPMQAHGQTSDLPYGLGKITHT